MNNKPIAFIVMPFGGDFDEIYRLFIAATLQDVGYQVVRADSVLTQQSILKDVVVGIDQADLVVADLTDSNANVFYELGVAHGLGKSVVMLTQRIDELPFDLRSYRVIPYSTHFSGMRQAQDRLREVATQSVQGQLATGSPVSDFLSLRQSVGPTASTRSAQSDADAGFLDHLVALEDGFADLVAIIGEYNSDTEDIGKRTSGASQKFQAAVQQKEMRVARAIVIGLAERLNDYAHRLNERNERYQCRLGDTRTSVEFVVRAHNPTSPAEQEQLRQLLKTLEEAELGASKGRAATSRFIETIRGLPNMERTFSRAASRTITELERLVENIDLTIAMIARAREIGQSKLPSA